MKILVTGSVAYDYIMKYNGVFSDRILPDSLESLTLSFLVEKLDKKFGGVAANIAYSLRLLDTDVAIAACVGNDFTPYRELLTALKVSTNYIYESTNDTTASFFGTIDKKNNLIGSFYSGAMRKSKKIPLLKIISEYKPTLTVISPNDPEAMIVHAKQLAKNNVPYVFDPAFQIAQIPEDSLVFAIKNAAILIANEYEMQLILDKLAISQEILRSYCPVVITTLGHKGSLLETRHEQIHINAAKTLKISDPTGAGDAYRSGFLAGYVRKLPLITCCKMGSVAASFCLEATGSMHHVFTKQSFLERYKNSYNENLSHI